MENIFIVFMIFVAVVCIFSLLIVVREVVKEMTRPKVKKKQEVERNEDDDEDEDDE